MIIKLPKKTRINLGGGQSFIKNLGKAITQYGYKFVEDGEYDILFIVSASLCDRETFRNAVENNKPIVLRVDNILEDGKNRNSGMSRLKEFAEEATVIIYQSDWCRRMLEPMLGKGVVIYNGVDTDIFYPSKIKKAEKSWRNTRIFYSKFSRNETKQFHEVIYWFREYCLEKKDDTLVLVGRYADDKTKIDHPFEFHNNEQYEYKGVIEDQNRLADILRSCDVAFMPYMFDACSNAILEAQACGLPVIYSHTGGTPEFVSNGECIDYFDKNPTEMVDNVLKENEFDFESFKNEFGLETMGERYHATIQTIIGKEYEI